METEQLQMIFSMLRDLGADGKQAFIWWLIIDGLIPVLAWVLIGTMMCFLVLRVIKLIFEEDIYLRMLRDMLHIGSPGDLTTSEKDAVVARVRELGHAETKLKEVLVRVQELEAKQDLK